MKIRNIFVQISTPLPHLLAIATICLVALNARAQDNSAEAFFADIREQLEQADADSFTISVEGLETLSTLISEMQAVLKIFGPVTTNKNTSLFASEIAKHSLFSKPPFTVHSTSLLGSATWGDLIKAIDVDAETLTENLFPNPADTPLITICQSMQTLLIHRIRLTILTPKQKTRYIEQQEITAAKFMLSSLVSPPSEAELMSNKSYRAFVELQNAEKDWESAGKDIKLARLVEALPLMLSFTTGIMHQHGMEITMPLLATIGVSAILGYRSYETPNADIANALNVNNDFVTNDTDSIKTTRNAHIIFQIIGRFVHLGLGHFIGSHFFNWKAIVATPAAVIAHLFLAKSTHFSKTLSAKRKLQITIQDYQLTQYALLTSFYEAFADRFKSKEDILAFLRDLEINPSSPMSIKLLTAAQVYYSSVGESENLIAIAEITGILALRKLDSGQIDPTAIALFQEFAFTDEAQEWADRVRAMGADDLLQLRSNLLQQIMSPFIAGEGSSGNGHCRFDLIASNVRESLVRNCLPRR